MDAMPRGVERDDWCPLVAHRKETRDRRRMTKAAKARFAHQQPKPFIDE
jgi:hypothetical protein